MRACDKRKTTFPCHPRPAIVSLGDNPRTTWQVKFCIHESRSAGDIGARLNEPLCLLLWFQRGSLTAEEYSFKYLSILGSARRGPPPTPGMDLCAPMWLSVFSVRAWFFPMHAHKRTRDVWSLSQVFSIHFYTNWLSWHPSIQHLRHSTFPAKFLRVQAGRAFNCIRKVHVIDRVIIPCRKVKCGNLMRKVYTKQIYILHLSCRMLSIHLISFGHIFDIIANLWMQYIKKIGRKNKTAKIIFFLIYCE